MYKMRLFKKHTFNMLVILVYYGLLCSCLGVLEWCRWVCACKCSQLGTLQQNTEVGIFSFKILL